METERAKGQGQWYHSAGVHAALSLSKCRWIRRPAVSSREAFREAADAASAGGQVLESSTTLFLLKAMNEQRLKEEGATAYSGGVASADSLGAGRSGVALVFVSVCGELHLYCTFSP